MKKILVLTSIYPGPNVPKVFTPIVHYFVKEWVNDGNEVKVIHNTAYYPRFFYMLSFLFSKLISTVTGTNIPSKRLSYDVVYQHENVHVSRFPMFKLFPHFKFSQKVFRKQHEKIIAELKQNNFIPDYIIGHWWNPQLELLAMLKKEFSETTTALVMHTDGMDLLKLYKSRTKELINNIDVFGFRSMPIKSKFETLLGKQKNSFMCYSGIPEKFTEQKVSKVFNPVLSEFLFVGVLIKRKFPSEILDSLHKVYPEKNFNIEFVGEGHESKKILNKSNDYNISSNIVLNSKVSREEVWNKMLKADCFIMISKDEAYGLVYLEAMAAGCITIASKNEGFDGVIVDGVNGFLCEAGNTHELAIIITKINKLTISEKQKISIKAMETALELTNPKASDNYLKSLEI